MKTRTQPNRGFTLIELLIVVAIIAILAAIATVNLREAKRRAETSACAANLKAIASGLAIYRIDWNHFPLADGVAGPQDSRGQTAFGEGPAANGYWSAVPNVLVTRQYISSREMLFCPSLAKQYPGRREHLRYAYNAGAADALGFGGGAGGPVDGVGAGGHTWVCRCLWLNTQGFAPDRALLFPHGAEPDPVHNTWGQENVLWADLSASLAPGNPP